MVQKQDPERRCALNICKGERERNRDTEGEREGERQNANSKVEYGGRIHFLCCLHVTIKARFSRFKQQGAELKYFSSI